MFIIIFYDGSINLIEEIDEDCFSELEKDTIDLTNPDELELLKKAIKNNPMWANIIKMEGIRRPNMKTKKDLLYSFHHTQKRLVSRYGILIDMKDYTEMCDRVDKKMDAKFISEEKQKNDIQQIYDILFKGTTIRVVWSTSTNRIKTVLPM